MKTKIIKLTIAIFITLQSFSANAQFNQITFGPNTIGRTNNIISAIGIGNFAATPSARLHVSNFILDQPTGALNGLLFRTDGRANQNVDNIWQMWTGTTAANTTEKFRLFVPGNNQTLFALQSTRGDMCFNTGEPTAGVAIRRMTILGGTNQWAGFVGIGTQWPGFRLEVMHDININMGTIIQNHGYRIGGIVVLQNPGWENVFVGEGAGFGMVFPSTTTQSRLNTFVGFNAGSDILNSGQQNTFIGANAGLENTIGYLNTFVGASAGLNNTSGSNNSFFGANTGLWNVTGSFNSYFGFQDGNGIVTNVGEYNSSVGAQAGINAIGGYNSFFGYRSGSGLLISGVFGLNSGNYNAFYGEESGSFNTTGSFNTYLGVKAGNLLQAGVSNTFIGYMADAPSSITTLTNASAIGANASVTDNNCMVLGSINSVNSAVNTIKVGIGTTSPDNRLEIFDSEVTTAGTSGLRLTNIGSFIPTANTTTALTVDPNGSGDVILRNISGATGPTGAIGPTGATGLTGTNGIDGATGPQGPIGLTGLTGAVGPTGANGIDGATGAIGPTGATGPGTGFGLCSSIPAISGHSGIKLNSYNLYFDGQGTTSSNSIGLGYYCFDNLPAKLSVKQNLIAGGQIGIDVINHNYGVLNKDAIGIQSTVDGFNNTIAGTTNIAGKFSVLGQTGADNDVAGYFTTNFDGNFTSKDWAIFVPKDGGKVQIGGYLLDNPPYLLSVYGSTASQNATWLTLSDSQLKTNITPYYDGLNIIKNINPVNFEYNALAGMPTGKKHVGIIAQQLAPIAPYMIDTIQMILDTTTNISTPILTLSADAFAYMSINAIKKLDSNTLILANTVDSLKNVISSITNNYSELLYQISQCCQQNGGAKIVNTINVELSNDAVLYQNIPNPFAEETTINYFIPDNTSNAKIIFFDMYGQSMKDVQLTTTGSGNIHVDSKNLASGIYSYSLVVDGKIIDTKKMVKSK